MVPAGRCQASILSILLILSQALRWVAQRLWRWWACALERGGVITNRSLGDRKRLAVALISQILGWPCSPC